MFQAEFRACRLTFHDITEWSTEAYITFLTCRSVAWRVCVCVCVGECDVASTCTCGRVCVPRDFLSLWYDWDSFRHHSTFTYRIYSCVISSRVKYPEPWMSWSLLMTWAGTPTVMTTICTHPATCSEHPLKVKVSSMTLTPVTPRIRRNRTTTRMTARWNQIRTLPMTLSFQMTLNFPLTLTPTMIISRRP